VEAEMWGNSKESSGDKRGKSEHTTLQLYYTAIILHCIYSVYTVYIHCICTVYTLYIQCIYSVYDILYTHCI